MAFWTAGNACVLAVHERVGGAPDPTGPDPRLNRYLRRWAKGTLRVAGVKVHQVGQVPPAPGRARLVVANHRSALDIPLLLSRFGGCVLSKADMQDVPLLGYGAKKVGCIFVDREDPRSGVEAMRQMRARLKDGRTLCVFPEGTTFAGDELHELNRGAFLAARGLDVELVVVGMAHPPGTEFVEDEFGDHVANFAGRSGVHVGMAIGKPRTLKGKPKVLVEQVREELQALVHEARRAVPRT